MLKYPALATSGINPTTASIPIPPTPATTSTQSPIARLDRLLQTIASVLKAYQVLPIRSPVYLASLQHFLQRAENLHPNPPDRHSVSSPSSPDSGGQNYYTPYERSARPTRRVPTGKEVDTLEREWWGSEVVAAWYGPQPGLLSGRTRGPWTTPERKPSREKDKRPERLGRRDDD